MCELPARSIPGSEIAFVEKTRIFEATSPLHPADEDAVVTVHGLDAEELVADLAGPRGDVVACLRVARPQLEHLADGDRRPLPSSPRAAGLGRQRRARRRPSPRAR